MQFFISHLTRWLCTRHFSEPTFRPSRPTKHWKNTAFRDFPSISRACIFFLLTVSLSLFCSSLFCFSSIHIVGSLTSKLLLNELYLTNIEQLTNWRTDYCNWLTDRNAGVLCFTPQRRAIFRHPNFQKWPEPEPLMFLTFWIANVLRATAACKFSFLIWPGGFAPAALASLLLDPPDPQNIGKTQRFATFLTLRVCIFFLLTVSLSLFCSSRFCFSSIHIVGSLWKFDF